MGLNYYTGTKTTIRHKILVASFSLVLVFLIIRGFWFYMDYDFKKSKEEILSNPVYVRGVIISKHSYKGKGVDIEYIVNGKSYVLSTGITTEFYMQHKLWDEVDIVYSKRKPRVSLLKEEIVYSK